jgi:hypothetical protein
MPHDLKILPDAELKYRGNTVYRMHTVATVCLEEKENDEKYGMLRLKILKSNLCYLFWEASFLFFYFAVLLSLSI